MNTIELPNASFEKPDWLKEVRELQVFVDSKASSILRALGPGDKEALKQLVEGVPILTSKIQDLTKLQQCRLNDIDKSYRQLEVERTLLSRKAVAQAQLDIAEEMSGSQASKLDLEARKRYQLSQALSLSMDRAKLDESVAANFVKETNRARGSEALRKQTRLLNKWTAYKDGQVTEAQAACHEASEEKARLSNALESMQKQMELLEGRNADENRALSTAKERNLILTEQLEDLNATTKSLEAAWEDNAKLQQQVSDFREETKQYRPCKDDFERSKRLQESSMSTVNDLKLRLQECKQELGNGRAQVATDIGLHSEALATKDDIMNDLHSSMNATERERDDLQLSLAETQSELQDYKAKSQDLHKQTEDLQLRLAETKSELQDHKTKSSDLDTQVEDLSARIHACRGPLGLN